MHSALMLNVAMNEYFQSISKTKHSNLKESHPRKRVEPGVVHAHAWNQPRDFCQWLTDVTDAQNNFLLLVIQLLGQPRAMQRLSAYPPRLIFHTTKSLFETLFWRSWQDFTKTRWRKEHGTLPADNVKTVLELCKRISCVIRQICTIKTFIS